MDPQVTEQILNKSSVAQTTTPDSTIQTTNAGPTTVDLNTSAPTSDPTELAKRLEIIAKQEKKFLDEKRAWKAEQEAYKKTLEDQYSPYKKYQDIESRLKNKDFSAVNELGFDYNEYTKTVLNDGNPPPEVLIQKALKEMEAKLDQRLAEKDNELKAKQEEAMTNHQKALRAGWTQEITQHLVKDDTKSKFPFLMSQPDHSEVVLNLIEEAWNKQQRKLTIDDAADMANKYYFDSEKERVKANASHLTDVLLEGLGIDKNQFDTFVASVKNSKQKAPIAAPSSQGTRTLTNDQTVQATGEAKARMTREQSIEAASKLLKFT
jgi:hypothetical protein